MLKSTTRYLPPSHGVQVGDSYLDTTTLHDLTSKNISWNKKAEKTSTKWHQAFTKVQETREHLDRYTQQNTKGLTNLKVGPPSCLDALSQAIWKHHMQLTLRECIQCIQIPAQETRLREIWQQLRQTIIQSKNVKELESWGAATTRGLNKGLTNKSKHSQPTHLPPPPPPPPPPTPPPPQPSMHSEDYEPGHSENQCVKENLAQRQCREEGPPFRELLRGEDFTPLQNPFEINRAIKPTKDIAQTLAIGIFGSRKKAGFLHYSILKYMLWYEPEEKKAFKPITVTTREGGKLVVRNWGQWKEVVRKRKCLLNNRQISLIADLYQIQMRFFVYGWREGEKFRCTGQTRYLHHRVINLLELADKRWTLLQGTTLPVPRYDWITGKFDFDYYLAACTTDRVQQTDHSKTERGEQYASQENITTERNTSTHTGTNPPNIPVTTPVDREPEAERESIEEEQITEQEYHIDTESILHTLFPSELIIDKPQKACISKRQIWQRWRNIVRNKNKRANKKYITATTQEKNRKESQRSVFDYTTSGLTESEIDLLSKGETFCPATQKIDTDQLKTDIYNYSRRLRLHEQFKDKQPHQLATNSRREETTGRVGRLIRRLSTTTANTTSRHTITPSQNTTTTMRHRQLPSTYDPLTQNRNLNRYTSGIQEDCLLAIKGEVRTKDNLHRQHRLALKTLRQKVENKQIMITKADKGSGIVVCDYDIYMQKGTRYIEEEAKAYRKVQDVETELVTKLAKHRNKVVDQLRQENVIPLHTATFCTKQIEEKITGMKFYFKIHKDQNIATTPLRPLQSCISAPTHHLSLVLTDILQPLLTTTNIPSFIYDSNHLLFRLQTLGTIPDNCTLVSSDVSALYPSIPHQQGLEAIQHFLNTNTHYTNTQTKAIIQALKLVISENYVMWDNNIYKQISGVAMGTPVAVAYANIFMAWVDSKVKQQTNYIHEHIRFIDDNLFILPEANIDNLMQIANSILPSIKYTHEKLDRTSSTGLAFLDTQLFISEDGHIEARLYTKPTDRHAYLLPSSYHPPHIVRNIPSAVFKRLRRLCSRQEWFVEDAEQAKGWLTNRGYNSTEVGRALEHAGRLDRWDMIVQIETNRGVTKTKSEDTYTIPFIVTYNKHAKTLKQVLARRQELLNNSYRHTKVKPRITFRRQRNLDNLLIQKALRGPIRHVDEDNKGFVKCGEIQHYRGECPCRSIHEKGLCRCCAHAHFEPIDRKVNFTKRVDCGSKNLVYLIGCRKCTKRYVGETQQTLRDRLAQHLSNISKFNQPLYLHFRLVHPPTNLFVTVLETVRSTEQFFRKVREAWWINHLQTLEPKGFNVKLECNQIYQEDTRR